MQVTPAQAFPYPQMFFVGGRVVGTAFPPLEPVGVLIVRQTLAVNGSPIAQEKVAVTDTLYAGAPDGDLTVVIESELVPWKPWCDIVAVRASSSPGTFGSFRVNRGTGFGAPSPLPYGWRDRRQGQRFTEAGDVAGFVAPVVNDPANPPPLVEKLRLPTGFSNNFYGGGAATVAYLKKDDVVEFTSGATVRSLVVPKGPVVSITGVPAPSAIVTVADTIVFDIAGLRFFVTWRSVFPWSAAMEAPAAKLMVS
jgi:hypothetical protein